MDGGDLLFRDVALPAGRPAELLRQRGRLLARAAVRADVSAVNVGRRDLAAGVDFLQRLAAEESLPWVASNLRLASGEYPFPRIREVQWGGVRVAVVGVLPADPPRDRRLGVQVVPPAEALRRVLAERGPVDAVVCLSTLGVAAERELVRSVAGIQFLVGGGSVEQFATPLREGDSLLLHAADRGRFLGVLEVAATAFAAWRAPPSSQQLALQAQQQTQLQRALEAEHSPARRRALAAQLQTLRQERAATLDPPKHRLLPLRLSEGEDPEVAAWVREWREKARRSRPQPVDQAAGGGRRRSPPASGAGYAGTGSCRRCHLPAYAAWLATPHARAYASLRGRPRSAECLECHAARIQRSAGTALEPMVGCEMCHGPAAEHRGAGDVRRVPTEEDCTRCHRGYHPEGVFEFAAAYARIRCDREGVVPAVSP